MSDQERLLDLLTSRATEGLSDERSRELDENLHRLADIDPHDLDLAAAAVDLAYGASAAGEEAMPELLKQRIQEQARSYAALNFFESRPGFPPNRMSP